MNLGEMRRRVLYQTNNDVDDLGDFQPYLTDYINEGYDMAAMAYAKQHVHADSDTYQPLNHEKSSPEVPGWLHAAIADWATWLVYRNGSVQKQNRGRAYMMSAMEMFNKAIGMTSDETGVAVSEYGRYIKNIPR
jgi:hypothetical protein